MDWRKWSDWRRNFQSLCGLRELISTISTIISISARLHFIPVPFIPEGWDERLGKLIRLNWNGYLIYYQLHILIFKTLQPDLSDYKFFCLDGNPVYYQVIRDRRSTKTIDFMTWIGSIRSSAALIPCLPSHIGNDTPNMQKAYFRKVIFYPMSGMGMFTPNKWNSVLEELIHLPKEES